MARGRKASIPDSGPSCPPAKTVKDREDQMIDLAVRLAEKQLRDGTASSQVLTHYLKLASTRELIEREKLTYETKLLNAKTEQIESTRRNEELFEKAIASMQKYTGGGMTDEDTDIF